MLAQTTKFCWFMCVTPPLEDLAQHFDEIRLFISEGLAQGKAGFDIAKWDQKQGILGSEIIDLDDLT